MNNIKKNFAIMEDFCALSLEQRFQLFIDFVAKQPPNKEYIYCDSRNCPLAQFARSLDFYKNNVHLLEYGSPFGSGDGKDIIYNYVGGQAHIQIIPYKHTNVLLPSLPPYTFGALHEKLAIETMNKWEFSKYLIKRFVKRVFGYV